ncbi:response regulator, partial [Neobacillus drentensis]|uniref:response regulator n=1 Tax=Neobacillus drentensis TaxID=220684 RepID=UPI0030024BC9
ADDDISRQFGGNGLGLSICKYLVSFMSGTMKLESTLGLGSKLTLQLPFDLSCGPLPIEQCEGIPPDDPIHTALVIERDAVIRQGLCSLLASIGMQVEWCVDFEDEQIHFERVDYIVMDLHVNEGAFDKWVQWRDQFARTGIKIIGIVSIHDRDEFSKYPAYIQPDAYLIQPVTQKGLWSVLESLNKRDEANVSLTTSASMKMNQQPCWISCLHDRKVLIVEDQEINQIVISEMIRSRCGQVTVVCDGFDALRNLAAENWDIILMDIHLPELDGVETTRIIRREERYRELPII